MTAVVDKPVGNNSCFTMVMTNWYGRVANCFSVVVAVAVVAVAN